MQDEICKLPALTFFAFYDMNKLHVDVLTESQAEFFPDFYVDF